MSDGDVRDRWPGDHRVVGRRPTAGLQRDADARPAPGGYGAERAPTGGPGSLSDTPTRGRASGSPGTIGGFGVSRPTGAPRPVAPTRPLAPMGADDIVVARGAPRAERAPYGRPAASSTRAAGWRRFTPILSGLAAGIALVAIGLGALILFSPRAAAPPLPSAAAQALCADLTGQRYADAYALLSPRLQAQGSQAQFVASQRELDALEGNVTACNSAIINVAGNSASASLQVTRAHAKSASAAVTLTVVGSVWRVDSYDTSVI